jgi:hypothetical protein
MNWKITLAALAALTLCLPACHQEKAEKPVAKKKAEAEAECKFKGDWSLDQTGDDVPANKKRTLTFSFNGNREGAVASGTLTVGTRPSDPSTFTASAADVATIEDGGAANIDWGFGGANVKCQVKFVEKCKMLEFSCPDDSFRIGRK